MTDAPRRTTPDRGATVEMVEEAAATGRVREVFDDIKRTKQIDFVPNFWKTLAAHPPLLEDTWQRLKRVMAPGALDARTKEMLAVAVSSTNGCAYCINSHTAAATKLGMTPEMYGELLEVVALFNATNTLADAFQVRPDVFP